MRKYYVLVQRCKVQGVVVVQEMQRCRRGAVGGAGGAGDIGEEDVGEDTGEDVQMSRGSDMQVQRCKVKGTRCSGAVGAGGVGLGVGIVAQVQR